MLRYVHEQTVASTTWTVAHNLGLESCAVEVLSDNRPILPASVVKSKNTVTITFSGPRSGRVIVSGSNGVVVDYAGFVQPVAREIDYTHSPTVIGPTTPPVTATPEPVEILLVSGQAADNPNAYGYVESLEGEEEWAYGSVSPAYPSVVSTNPSGSVTGLTRLGEFRIRPSIVDQGTWILDVFFENSTEETLQVSSFSIGDNPPFFKTDAEVWVISEYNSIRWSFTGLTSNFLAMGSEHTIEFLP